MMPASVISAPLCSLRDPCNCSVVILIEWVANLRLLQEISNAAQSYSL